MAGWLFHIFLSLSLYYLSISLYICFSNSAHYPLMIYFVSSTLSILSFFPLLHYYKHFFLWSFFSFFFFLIGQMITYTHTKKKSFYNVVLIADIFSMYFFFLQLKWFSLLHSPSFSHFTKPWNEETMLYKTNRIHMPFNHKQLVEADNMPHLHELIPKKLVYDLYKTIRQSEQLVYLHVTSSWQNWTRRWN